MSAAPDRTDRSRGTLIAVALALFCIQIDFFGLNLALPAMARLFGVGAGLIEWAVSAYMLSLGSLFILAGRIGDIFGRRKVLLCGIATFGCASAGCALSPSLAVLVACSIVQGAGAAVIFPVGIGAVSNAFGEQRRAWALGLAFGFGNIGMALGPFAGGGLSSGPGSAVGVLAARAAVRDRAVRRGAQRRRIARRVGAAPAGRARRRARRARRRGPQHRRRPRERVGLGLAADDRCDRSARRRSSTRRAPARRRARC